MPLFPEISRLLSGSQTYPSLSTQARRVDVRTSDTFTTNPSAFPYAFESENIGLVGGNLIISQKTNVPADTYNVEVFKTDLTQFTDVNNGLSTNFGKIFHNIKLFINCTKNSTAFKVYQNLSWVLHVNYYYHRTGNNLRTVNNGMSYTQLITVPPSPNGPLALINQNLTTNVGAYFNGLQVLPTSSKFLKVNILESLLAHTCTVHAILS